MKIFFFLLLLTNIIFAVVQWLLPYEQLFSKTQPIAAAEQLRLLDEGQVPATSQSSTLVSENATETVEKPSGKLCYTLGPFKKKEDVQEVVQSFNNYNLQVRSRPSMEKEYLGMMVYIGGQQTRKQAREVAKSLAEQGVRDFMIVQDEGQPFALSLGVFGLKKNAERRMSRINELGYDARTEARYRDRTIYWLDYDEKENDVLKRLVDKLKAEQGISRISRLCG